MKKATYNKLSKFTGKKSRPALTNVVTEVTENKIYEYATDSIVMYRITQENDINLQPTKIVKNLTGLHRPQETYPSVHHLIDKRFEKSADFENILKLIDDYKTAKALEYVYYETSLNNEKINFNTKSVAPLFEFLISILADKTETDFHGGTLKLEFDSKYKPVKITLHLEDSRKIELLATPVRVK